MIKTLGSWARLPLILPVFSGVPASTSPAAPLSPPHAPQRRVDVLAVPKLAPVAEALIPRVAVDVLRGRPVPPGGIRTGYVKCSFECAFIAVLPEHIQLGL